MGGLGFNYKWNMGWMNDCLSYMPVDPYFKSGCHNKLTFSMCYSFSENYILPISHDEVVHGKKSLLDKMPGDIPQKFSNMRTFLMYMFAHPGKKLNFMGNEYGQFKEWDYKEGLEFFMLKFDLHNRLHKFTKKLNGVYKHNRPFYEVEDSWDGFNWICADECDNNVLSFVRKDKDGNSILAIFNFSGNDYLKYRLGCDEGQYKLLFTSDRISFGGTGRVRSRVYKTRKKIAHGHENSICFTLPKFSAIYFIKTV
jgi:1,4-alpha-glucan branching enzyme